MKDKIIAIYKITFPDSSIYIGQSIDLKRRISEYKSTSKIKSQKLLYSKLQTYKFLESYLEILEIIKPNGYFTKEILDTLEKYYISMYKSNRCKNKNGKGLNLTTGGVNSKYLYSTAETKLKISLNSQRKKLTPEHKEKLRLANLGNKYTLGVRPSKETLELLSKIRKGKSLFKNKRAVLAFNLDGSFHKEYDSVLEACRESGIGYSSDKIPSAIKRNGTSCGFIWIYKDAYPV